MRRSGSVEAVEGLGSHDHLCWAFDSPLEYRSAAGRFLADGLAAGQRVIFVGDPVDGSDTYLELDAAAGAAQVESVHLYGSAGPVDPAVQVSTYARATERAVADGFSGLRVAADVTSLVGTAEARAAFVRYEHLIDVYMTSHPFTAMCAYNRAVLGRDAVAELACVHPLVRRSSTAVQLFASDEPGVAVVLTGELDMAGYAQLRTALERVSLPPVDGVVTIDARDLSFIDHRGLIQLVEHVRGRGATTVLLARQHSMVSMLAGLLDLPGLRVVAG